MAAAVPPLDPAVTRRVSYGFLEKPGSTDDTEYAPLVANSARLDLARMIAPASRNRAT